MKGKRGSRVSRPLSTAANFFRRNGASEKADEAAAQPPTRALRATTRVLECQPEERELLRSSILPSIVEYLGKNSLRLDSLFQKDPSVTQESMMGLTSPGEREPVRALRELLDARFSHDEGSVFASHHPYIWAISLKVLLKELPRPLVPLNVVVSLLEVKDYDSIQGKVDFIRTRFVPECPDVLQNIFHVLHDCLSDKERLGYMFSALLFLSIGQDDADFARLATGVEALSDATKFMVAHAEEVFGQSPYASYAPPAVSKSSAPPPPPRDNNGGVSMYGRGDADDSANDSGSIRSNGGGGSSRGFGAPPPPPPLNLQASVKGGLFTVTCIYDFDPIEPDELELRVGDVVTVLNVTEDDWYRGRLVLPDGAVEEGVFPATYVKKDDSAISTPRPQPSPIGLTQAPPPPPPAKKSDAPVFRPEFSAYDDEEEQDRFEQASQSVFATTSVPPPAPPPVVASSAPPPPSPVSSGKEENLPAIAMFDFNGEEANELDLTKGESLIILNRTDPEWWLGKRIRDGVIGLFPYNYAKLVNSLPSSSSTPPPAPASSPLVNKAPAPPPPAPSSSSQTNGNIGSSAGAGRGTLQRSSSNRPRPPAPPPPSAVLGAIPAVGQAAAPQPPMMQPQNRMPAPTPVSAPLPLGSAPVTLPPPSLLMPQNSQSRLMAPPPTLSAQSQPTMRMPAPPPMIGGPVPQASLGDPVANNWIVTPDLLAKYQNFYAQQPKDPLGRVMGKTTAMFLEQSNLDRPTIVRILELSDLDRDTCFDADEFSLAMHLALCVSRRNMQLPQVLPDWLIPPSKKILAQYQQKRF